jgi:DNA (cytosine-5)-methyltransferase 1
MEKKGNGLMNNPSPEEIKAARLAAGLTQTEAAKLVHCTKRAWQMWEAEEEAPHRTMHPAMWELFLEKTKDLRKEK